MEENKENILEESNRLIHGARNDAYGHPLEDFSKTAKMWEAVLSKKLIPGATVTAEDVALMMVCVKISRLVNTPNHRDSIVDIAGYAGTYEMVVEERAKRLKEWEDKMAEEITKPLKSLNDSLKNHGGTITISGDSGAIGVQNTKDLMGGER